MLMRSVLQFFGPTGDKLEELVLCDALTGLPASEEQIKSELQDPEPNIVYIGVIQIPIGVNIPPSKDYPNGLLIDVRNQEIKFQIEASNRKEAFEKFKAEADAIVNELKAKHEEKQRQQHQQQCSGLIIPTPSQSEAINNLRLVTE